MGDKLFVSKGVMIAHMYHHSTPDRNKHLVETEFPQPNSRIRLVIATSAFGMGIDVPDIYAVINWECRKSTSEFIQQSGRAGRSGEISAFSLTNYSGHDTSTQETDSTMQQFCRNLSNNCRRQIALQFYGGCGCDNAYSHSMKHSCCNVCAACCHCTACPALPWNNNSAE